MGVSEPAARGFSGRAFSASASARLAPLNRRLLQAERDLCDEAGLPDRPWFRHLIYACRYTYAALTLPGLTEAVERGDARRSRERARLLPRALGRAGRRVR
jgi:N-acetylated-alpha-linked acidic dipeptidase